MVEASQGGGWMRGRCLGTKCPKGWEGSPRLKGREIRKTNSPTDGSLTKHDTLIISLNTASDTGLTDVK